MRRPIPRLIPQKYGKNIPSEQLQDVTQAVPNYADKLKLATSLHEQGIDPIRWQEAEPAPNTAQRLYRETRQAPDDMFVVQDRLYRRSPAIAATPDQGKDDLDVYLGAAPKPIAELVPVDRVQLRHPPGNKPATLPAGSEALERYRRFAKLGIDPDNAHEGDAIPHHLQDGLKRAVIGVDGKEMPLGIPGVYRNPDDGFFYLAHSGTEEGKAVKDLRTRLATEKMERTGSADPIAANDNDPDIDEAVAQFYAQNEKKTIHQDAPAPTPVMDESAKRFKTFIDAVKKTKQEIELNPDELEILTEVDKSVADAGYQMDVRKLDPDELKAMPALLGTTAAGTIAWPSFAGAGVPAAGGVSAAGGAGASTIALPALGFAALPFVPIIIGRMLGIVPPPRPNKLGWYTRAPYPNPETEARLLAQKALQAKPVKTEEKATETPSLQLQGANDNQPDPANDNDPSRGPNLTATTAATVTAGLLNTDSKEVNEESIFTPSEKFDPKSQNMRDFQEDFAHAIVQGQLPEITLNGEVLTAPNRGGMLGGPATRKLDERAAEAVAQALKQCRGISNAKQAGGRPKIEQFRIKDIEAKGNKNSVSLDVSFTFNHGTFNCAYHLNSVDTNAKGLPNSREMDSLKRMQENVEKIHKLASNINKKFAHAKTLKESGYAYDWIKKAMTEDDAEIDKAIADFMKDVFSCSRIVRECWRTQPTKR